MEQLYFYQETNETRKSDRKLIVTKIVPVNIGDLALLTTNAYNSRTPQLGVIQGVDSVRGRNNNVLVIFPSFSLREPFSLGGVEIPFFERRDNDQYEKRYLTNRLDQFYAGTTADIARALEDHWPSYKIYATLIQQMQKPYLLQRI